MTNLEYIVATDVTFRKKLLVSLMETRTFEDEVECAILDWLEADEGAPFKLPGQGEPEVGPAAAPEGEPSGRNLFYAVADRLGVDCADRSDERIAELMLEALDEIERDRQLPEGVAWPRWEDGELVEFGQRLPTQPSVDAVCFKRTVFELQTNCGADSNGSYLTIDRDLYGTTYMRALD